MSYILQIETATTVCSVALAKDGEVMAFKQLDERNIHAEIINIFIEELVTAARLNFSDLDAIAVSCGPGSYTGLRIGVSTAKGLCFALDKPLIAVETLAAMAGGVIALNEYAGMLLCPMIDARRMEVYTALFDSAGNRVEETSAKIIDADSFKEQIDNNKILFFGDGADKCRSTLAHANAQFLPGYTNSATHLTALAFEKYKKQEFEDVAYFEPYYLKDFIAGKKSL